MVDSKYFLLMLYMARIISYAMEIGCFAVLGLLASKQTSEMPRSPNVFCSVAITGRFGFDWLACAYFQTRILPIDPHCSLTTSPCKMIGFKLYDVYIASLPYTEYILVTFR